MEANTEASGATEWEQEYTGALHISLSALGQTVSPTTDDFPCPLFK